MSGIYIPMKPMPKCCGECSFCIVCGGYHYCTAAEFTLMPKEYLDTTHAYCPLIPVPDHGRLVDENDILNALEPVHMEEKAAIAWKHIYANEKYLLSKVLTIIPADHFAKDTNVPTKAADKEAGE